MERRHELYPMIIMPGPPEPRNGDLAFQKGLDRELTQSNNDLRLYQLDLLLQKWLTGLHLIGLRITVFRRTTLNDVGDINIFSLKPHAFGNNIREELPRAPHKWLPLQILIPARPFTYEHKLRLRIPYTEYDVGSAGPEFTAAAITDSRTKLFQGFCLIGRSAVGKQVAF